MSYERRAMSLLLFEGNDVKAGPLVNLTLDSHPIITEDYIIISISHNDSSKFNTNFTPLPDFDFGAGEVQFMISK